MPGDWGQTISAKSDRQAISQDTGSSSPRDIPSLTPSSPTILAPAFLEKGEVHLPPRPLEKVHLPSGGGLYS